MRRRDVLLSALTFAFAMSGEALAKDAKQKPPKLTDAEKAERKEQAAEKKSEQTAKEDKGGGGSPLIRLRGASSSGRNSKPESSWLRDKHRY